MWWQILGVSIIYPVRKALFLERVTEVEEKRKCSDDEWSDDELSDEGASEEEEGHGLENLNPLSLKKKKKSSAESEKR
nr:hypothetical protein Iba_scaffold1408011CG0010 [Ipomoea batatas]